MCHCVSGLNNFSYAEKGEIPSQEEFVASIILEACQQEESKSAILQHLGVNPQSKAAVEVPACVIPEQETDTLTQEGESNIS